MASSEFDFLVGNQCVVKFSHRSEAVLDLASKKIQ